MAKSEYKNEEFVHDFVNIESNEHKFKSENEVSIGWRNLRFEVKQYGGLLGKNKPILRRLNGSFEYHSLNGLMGPSGAGKTTLLNCLSGNKKNGLTKESEIYLNSKEKSPISYFITQHVHESIVGRMRVLDIFRYAYRFKNGSSAIGRMDEHIGTVMAELMLPVDILSRHFAQCSGGEQKRIAIGQELMTLNKPTFLFVDEPTTGLDSAAAFEVVKCLKQLTVKYRITVIASIHAPSNEILNLFDKLYVLAKGGVCIYSGPTESIKPYLEEHIQQSFTEGQPPIEVLLKVACNGIVNSDVQKLSNPALTFEHAKLISKLSQLTLRPQGIPSTRKHFTMSDFLLQLFRLSRINFISNFRTFLFNIFLYTIFFVFITSIFSSNMAGPSGCYQFFIDQNIDEDNVNKTTCNKAEHLHDDAKVKENTIYLSYVYIMVGFLVMCTSGLWYGNIIKVFRSEHRNHWYSLGVFYWSATIVTFIEMAILALLISSLSYFLSNQQLADMGSLNWYRFGHWTVFMFLLCLYCQALGQMVGVFIINHLELGVIICQLFFSSTCMFNGLLIKLNRHGNDFLIKLSDWVGMIHISSGLYYTLYGIDRCQPETEFSWILLENNVDVNAIQHYFIRIVINVVIVRLFTLVFMFYRFNSFSTMCLQKSNCPKRENMISIDFDFNSHQIGLSPQKFDMIDRSKKEEEFEFENFSRNKIIIGWRNLSLYGTSSVVEIGSKRQNIILHKLNGQFCFGTLNALMGTSGAGKTSLLKVLNGRSKTRLSDETLFYLSRFTKIETCFITQEVSGHLMPGLTAKQSLVYASRLKNLNSQVDHEQIALSLLEELDLIDTAGTKVDRCSGGERKRLALALELTSIRMPNLICIDEPTSGLDSNSAETVISCLHKLTRTHNLTILASIHQPNTSILSMFDQLYVLARGGVCIFSGPPSQVQSHLSHISQIKPTESQFAIETVIQHSCSDYNDPIVQQLVQLQNSHYPTNLENDLELTEQTQPIPDGVVRNRPRFSSQSVYILTARFIAYIRGHLWKELLFNIVGYLCYAISLTRFFDRKMIYVSGCLNLEDDFNNTCAKTAKDVEDEFLLTDNVTFSYFYANIYLFLILLQSSLGFFREYVFFENEHRNGWYSSGSFYLMKSLLESLPLIPINMIYVFIGDIYEPVAPRPMYWQLVLVLTLASIGFQGMAHFFSLLAFNDLTILTLASQSFYLISLIISNFYVPIHEMHYVYQFLSNFSIVRFTYEAVILLQYGFGRCGPKEIQSMLHSMSIQDDDYYTAIRMLLFNLVFFRLITTYLLIVRVNPIENRRKRVNRISKFREMLHLTKAKTTGLGQTGQEFRIRLNHA